jgi:hypothetical protein
MDSPVTQDAERAVQQHDIKRYNIFFAPRGRLKSPPRLGIQWKKANRKTNVDPVVHGGI